MNFVDEFREKIHKPIIIVYLFHSVLRLDATVKKRYDGKLFKFKKFSIK